MSKTVKPRLIAIATGVLAVLATGSIFAGEAAAGGSGGIGSSAGTEEATTSGTAGTDSSNAPTSAKYERLWDRVGPADRHWARRTSACESGGDPDAIGGGGLYRGAFQFRRSTWRTSPKSPGGDPIAYPYRTQAVVAVSLKRRDGVGHWPVCG